MYVSESFVPVWLQFPLNHPKTSWASYLNPIWVVQMQLGSVTFDQGHFRSYNVTRLLLITSCRNEVEGCMRSHCVQLVKAHRLMRLMMIECLRSPLDLKVTWPEIKFRHWPFGVNKYVLMFRWNSRREKHDVVRVIALTFFVQKLFTKGSMATWGRLSDIRGRPLTWSP